MGILDCLSIVVACVTIAFLWLVLRPVNGSFYDLSELGVDCTINDALEREYARAHAAGALQLYEARHEFRHTFGANARIAPVYWRGRVHARNAVAIRGIYEWLSRMPRLAAAFLVFVCDADDARECADDTQVPSMLMNDVCRSMVPLSVSGRPYIQVSGEKKIFRSRAHSFDPSREHVVRKHRAYPGDFVVLVMDHYKSASMPRGISAREASRAELANIAAMFPVTT